MFHKCDRVTMQKLPIFYSVESNKIQKNCIKRMLLYASLSTIAVFVCKIQYLEMVNIIDFEKESLFIFKLLHAYELKSG